MLCCGFWTPASFIFLQRVTKFSFSRIFIGQTYTTSSHLPVASGSSNSSSDLFFQGNYYSLPCVCVVQKSASGRVYTEEFWVPLLRLSLVWDFGLSLWKLLLCQVLSLGCSGQRMADFLIRVLTAHIILHLHSLPLRSSCKTKQEIHPTLVTSFKF